MDKMAKADFELVNLFANEYNKTIAYCVLRIEEKSRISVLLRSTQYIFYNALYPVPGSNVLIFLDIGRISCP